MLQRLDVPPLATAALADALPPSLRVLCLCLDRHAYQPSVYFTLWGSGPPGTVVADRLKVGESE